VTIFNYFNVKTQS